MDNMTTGDDAIRTAELHGAVEGLLAVLEQPVDRPGPTYMLLAAEDVAALTARLLRLRADDVLAAVEAWLVEDARCAGRGDRWCRSAAERLRRAADAIDAALCDADGDSAPRPSQPGLLRLFGGDAGRLHEAVARVIRAAQGREARR